MILCFCAFCGGVTPRSDENRCNERRLRAIESLCTQSAEVPAMTESHAIFLFNPLRRKTLLLQRWVATKNLALKVHSFALARLNNKSAASPLRQ
jgi:hypothetical protein